MEKVLRCLDILDFAMGEAALLGYNIRRALEDFCLEEGERPPLVLLNRCASPIPGHVDGILNFYVHSCVSRIPGLLDHLQNVYVHTGERHYHTILSLYTDKLGGISGLHIIIEFTNSTNVNALNRAFIKRVNTSRLVKVTNYEHKTLILCKSFDLTNDIKMVDVVKAILDTTESIVSIYDKYHDDSMLEDDDCESIRFALKRLYEY